MNIQSLEICFFVLLVVVFSGLIKLFSVASAIIRPLCGFIYGPVVCVCVIYDSIDKLDSLSLSLSLSLSGSVKVPGCARLPWCCMQMYHSFIHSLASNLIDSCFLLKACNNKLIGTPMFHHTNLFQCCVICKKKTKNENMQHSWPENHSWRPCFWIAAAAELGGYSHRRR